MATDWNHIVLAELNRGETTHETLLHTYPKASAEIRAALLELERRGHADRGGGTWAITEQGRARYTIDDNCKGW